VFIFSAFGVGGRIVVLESKARVEFLAKVGVETLIDIQVISRFFYLRDLKVKTK